MYCMHLPSQYTCCCMGSLTAHSRGGSRDGASGTSAPSQQPSPNSYYICKGYSPASIITMIYNILIDANYPVFTSFTSNFKGFQERKFSFKIVL